MGRLVAAVDGVKRSVVDERKHFLQKVKRKVSDFDFLIRNLSLFPMLEL